MPNPLPPFPYLPTQFQNIPYAQKAATTAVQSAVDAAAQIVAALPVTEGT